MFSGGMVRAILDGKKTQTRRAIKPQPVADPTQAWRGDQADSWIWHGGKALLRATYGAPYVHTGRHAMERAMVTVSPFQVGLRLWVRETYVMAQRILSLAHTPCYRADEGITEANRMLDGSWPWKWIPSIHMRREHSRLLLEVTDVRAERLWDIGWEDCEAEGIGPCPNAGVGKAMYRELWNSINGKRAWDANPWVWAVTFKKAG